MNAKIYVVLAYAIASVFASKSPVLIWSSSRPLADLPQAFAGKTVDANTFKTDFLKPLSSDKNQHLVVFLQDKLSLEDFTNHADVYNPNGDGGAFKNIKTTMDDQYSAHLPAVTSPHVAIETLSKNFPGQVVRTDNADNLATLQLKDGEQYLIIVNLKPTVGKDEAKAFQANDEMMGKCMHHLNKRGLQYSALYTGKVAAEADSGDVYQGRHLMEVINYNTNGTFYNESLIMLYYKYINLTISQPDGTETKKFAVHFDYNQIKANATQFNKTSPISLTLSMDDNKGSTAVLAMLLRTTPRFEWRSSNETLTFKNTNKTFDFEKMPVNLDISATLNWCYHCTKLVAKPVVRGYNNTKKQTISFAINGFQLEAFNNRTVPGQFTDNVWDCVEFFSVPIWMGIITTLVLVMILFFGMTMVANITTMDRFDDPKGKTISVTVNE